MKRETSGTSTALEVEPATLSNWLDQREVVLVDVRERFEHAAEHIPGDEHRSLSSTAGIARDTRYRGKRVVFYCRTGKRSRHAAQRFAHDTAEVYSLSGGIEAWKASGRRVVGDARVSRLDVMRQVQIAAGALVLVGTLLGALLSPWFLLLSGLMGAGLVFAGASGWCGMAILLSRMPWNRAMAEPDRSNAG
jgi:rhodanese-related sulfurtransferase